MKNGGETALGPTTYHIIQYKSRVRMHTEYCMILIWRIRFRPYRAGHKFQPRLGNSPMRLQKRSVFDHRKTVRNWRTMNYPHAQGSISSLNSQVFSRFFSVPWKSSWRRHGVFKSFSSPLVSFQPFQSLLSKPILADCTTRWQRKS